MGQRLGQHFLSDSSVLDKIRDQIEIVRVEFDIRDLIEIGPGQWALTKEIIEWSEKILAMEADRWLEMHINRLSKQAKTLWVSFDVLWGDALQQDLSLFDQEKRIVVWNLPYYITSPIFRKFFVDNNFPAWTFLIQKEVGEKMMTTAKKKSYLWWLLRYSCFVVYNFTVPASAFSPPPKVESAVVTIRRHNEKYPFSLERLQSFLDIVSQFSRKTLGKIQKMRKIELEEIHVVIDDKSASKRMEALSRDEVTVLLTQ